MYVDIDNQIINLALVQRMGYQKSTTREEYLVIFVFSNNTFNLGCGDDERVAKGLVEIIKNYIKTYPQTQIPLLTIGEK